MDRVVWVTNASARVAHLQVGDVLFVFDQVDGATIAGIVLAHGAFDFRVPGVADQDALAAIAAVARHFDVHLGHQWAGGVEDFQATAGRLGAHRLGNTVGTEDDDDVVRHLVQFLDKDRAACAQVFDDELVVHHFVAHVDRRPEDFQGAVDDFDRPVHAGAEATGLASLICMLCLVQRKDLATAGLISIDAGKWGLLAIEPTESLNVSPSRASPLEPRCSERFNVEDFTSPAGG
jgi:hypothetical protein